MIKVDHIRIEGLVAYTASTAFQQSEVIPISQRRAKAQAANPRAEASDVALILVYLEGRLVGYLGLIPDWLFTQKGAERVAWMSCIWVSPLARGKGVAKRMLRDAFEVWDNRLLATEFTTAARSLYDKMGLFDDLVTLPGWRVYLRLNSAFLLPKKNPRYRYIRPLLQIADGLFNLFHDLRIATHRYPNLPLVAEEIKTIDSSTYTFIQNLQQGELLQRKREDLNWLLQHPWMANDQEAQADASRYYFSVYAQRFEFRAYRLTKTDQLVAFALLAIRDDALKVPYLYCLPNVEKEVGDFIGQFMRQEKLSILTTYVPVLHRYFQKQKAPFFSCRPFQRAYLISRGMNKLPLLQPIQIHDGDGDCAFT
ncbi:MAG: GNAT family N-acetyltransferase [Bacteroidota bacterium]